MDAEVTRKNNLNKPAEPGGDARLPPRGGLATMKLLGPGLIISGAIVGSGELIATTTLGARVGFSVLWLIILSCLIKVTVQEQLARYTITTGETTLAALDKVPGPRWRASWVVWCWMVMFVGITFQIGGIVGGVAQVFHLTLPQVSVTAWTLVTSFGTALLLLQAGYRLVERTCTFMVVSFTFITVACALLLFETPYAVRWDDVVEGFRLRLPPGGLAVTFAVFGITGVGATELIYYPYWCLEKGYAKFAGPNDHSAAWLQRVTGWASVMQIDARLALALYTAATLAFYVLGAGVLHSMGQIPKGYEMVDTLAHMYTSTLGEGAYFLFLLGAFMVLFSTVFSGTASNSRVLVDFLELIQAIRVGEEDRRRFWRRLMVVLLLSIYTTWHLFIGQPVFMVIIGGLFQASMLPIIAFSAIYLRYKYTEPSLRPSLVSDILLWICSTLMLAFALYTLIVRLLNP